MDKQTKTLNYLINLSFFLYFIILVVERALSVVLSLVNGINIFDNAFHGFVYVLVFVSILGWLIFLVLKCRDNIKYLFKPSNNISFNYLCIASGIILLSGMVHTEYTIPVIQFISYGILIIGILLKVILINNNSKNRLLLWLSFSYLVAFSMAIPVMYHSLIDLSTLFHIIEATAVFVLVASFSVLLLMLFDDREDLFNIVPIILALVLDVPLIIMRWNEEINFFVLIFISLSAVLFAIGFIAKQTQKKQD